MSHRPTSVTHNRAVIESIAPKIAPFRPDMIISGGQDGADFGGLLGSADCGIPTGGIAPKGWRTESGPRSELGSVFGLTESESENYNVRTRENILICDVVILVARDFDSPGSYTTAELARKHGKPLFPVDFPRLPSLEWPYLVADMRSWLRAHRAGIINVAGNRESKARGIQQWTRQMVIALFA